MNQIDNALQLDLAIRYYSSIFPSVWGLLGPFPDVWKVKKQSVGPCGFRASPNGNMSAF
jgi:hypothetical protein